MGSSYNCKCGKCGYQISVNMGVGFAFPRLYKRTVEEMKNGKYGKKAEDFFKSFPDGAIDYDQTIAKCSSCGELFEVTSMNMYVLKPGHSIPSSKGQVWSTAAPFTDAEYITTWDLDEHYELFEKYEYTCPECGAAAETVDNAERLLMDNKLICSKCGEGTMRAQLTMNWD